jgi:hypothetical protein
VENRTPDPLNAIEVLYQLSYDPSQAGAKLKNLPSGCQRFSFDSKDLSSGFGNHALMPRRIPHNVDAGLGNSIQS